MRMEASRTREGWPMVAWIQETAETGATVGSQKVVWAMLLGTLGGMGLGFMAGGLPGVFAGGLAGALFLLFGLGQQAKERGGPDPADAEPILSRQYCEARVVEGRDTLFLAWRLEGRRMKDDFVIPLAEATELAAGAYNDWFGGQSRGTRGHESHVIVLPHRSGVVYRLADHAGPKADIAALHGLLLGAIIEPREALLRRFAEIAEQAKADATFYSTHSETPETL